MRTVFQTVLPVAWAHGLSLGVSTPYVFGRVYSRTVSPQKDVGTINFFIHYEVDEDTSKHSLQLSAYGKEKEWVLLAPAP